jgi:hypothetical protein
MSGTAYQNLTALKPVQSIELGFRQLFDILFNQVITAQT